MRVLWFSNSPWAKSGYGVQTALLAPRIRAAGHQVGMISNTLTDGLLNWDGMPVYPAGFGGVRPDLVRAQVAQFRADVVISFLDAWQLNAAWFNPCKWAPWYPVDRDPFPAALKDALGSPPGGAHMHAVCSRFGQRAAEDAGLQSDYIPCCVDTKAFTPGDMAEARRAIGLPQDKFIVGIVADNKGYPCRKAIMQQIEAFARAAQPDWLLYIHTHAGDKRGGQRLGPLLEHLGIGDQCRFPNQDHYEMGQIDTAYMVNVYRSINVLSAVTMDEGFGVPIVEAQACGTPVIAGDWTAMPELVYYGMCVDKSQAEHWWNPTGGYQFLPHIDAVANALRCAADGFRLPSDLTEHVAQYDVDHVFDAHWKPWLAKLADSISAPTNGKPALAGATA